MIKQLIAGVLALSFGVSFGETIDYYWTGKAGDNDFNAADNWADVNGGAVSAPNSNSILIFTNTTALALVPSATVRAYGYRFLGSAEVRINGTKQHQFGAGGVTNNSSALTHFDHTTSFYNGLADFYAGQGSTIELWKTVTADASTIVNKCGPGLMMVCPTGTNPGIGDGIHWRVSGGTLQLNRASVNAKPYPPRAVQNMTFDFAGANAILEFGNVQMSQWALSNGCSIVEMDECESVHTHTIKVSTPLFFSGNWNNTTFHGCFAGSSPITWRPTNGATFTLSGSTSPSFTGSLSVDSGVFKLTDGATLTPGDFCVSTGAQFRIETENAVVAPNGNVTINYDPEGDVKPLYLAKGATIKAAGSCTVNGTPLPVGSYTASNCDWIAGEGGLDITSAYEDEGRILRIFVPAGGTQTMTTALPTTVTNVIKTGTGTLQFSPNNFAQSESLRARWDITEGVVIGNYQVNFGRNSTVHVGPNATLKSYGATNIPVRQSVYFAGTLDVTQSGGITGKFDPLVLEGNTAQLLYADGASWGVYQTSLHMNGYSLTLKGKVPALGNYSPAFRLAGHKGDASATIYNAGDIILDKAHLEIEGTDKINFYSSGTTVQDVSGKNVVLKNGSMFTMFDRVDAFPMGLRVTDTGILQISTSGWGGAAQAERKALGYNQIAGPITVDDGAKLSIYTRGDTHCTLSGAMRGGGEIHKSEKDVGDSYGHLWITGKVDRTIGKLTHSRGLIVLRDAGDFSVTGSTASAIGFATTVPKSANWFAPPVLRVERDSRFFAKAGLVVANGSYENAGLDILDNGFVSNKLTVAGGANAGYVRQFSGTNFFNNGSAIGNAAGGYGVYVITNGFAGCEKDTCFELGNSGMGLYYQLGGYSKPDYSLQLAKAGGQGDVYLGGGQMYDKNSIYTGQSVGTGTAGNGRATITLDGDDVDYFSNFIGLHAKSGEKKFRTQVNLRKGNLRPTFLYRDSDPAAHPGARFYLTADGGKLSRGNSNAGGGSWTRTEGESGHANWRPIDKLVVYKGGITFSISGSNCWESAIVAPTGKGVKSITLPQKVLDNRGYLGPAKLDLTITKGNGDGVTAVCDYVPTFSYTDNREYGYNRGVIVTCPGWDLEEGDVSCTVYHPNVRADQADDFGEKQPFACTVELEENDRSGGITIDATSSSGSGPCKEGTLTLTSNENTYEGETFVKRGKLVIAQGASLPAASPIRMANSSTIAFRNTEPVAVSNLTAEGSCWLALNGKLTIHDKLTVDAAQISANGNLTVTGGVAFGPDAKIVVKNAASIGIKRLVVVSFVNGTPDASLLSTPIVDEDGNSLSDKLKLTIKNKTLVVSEKRGLLMIIE